MKNKYTKHLILFLGAIIFTFAMVNSASAQVTPDCMISNFTANGRSSITVQSGSTVTLSWSSRNCKYIKLSGRGVGTNIDESGYMNINPTASSEYKIVASVNGFYPLQGRVVEVNVIPAPAINTTTNTTNTSNVNNVMNVSNTTNTSNTVKTSSVTSKSTNSTADKNLSASDTGNNITALSIRGSGGFMPSSIWQWLLVIFLILIIIILSRLFVKKPTPGDHDIHAHTH